MIFQAKSASSPWNLAYLEREGRDPMGAFTAPEGFTNPCVLSGDIWTRIADDENDDCVKITVLKRKIFEEGTPEIVQEENGTFYVTFHGAAPDARRSMGFGALPPPRISRPLSPPPRMRSSTSTMPRTGMWIGWTAGRWAAAMPPI